MSKEEKDLEQFKTELIKSCIDSYLDRLLELRNDIRNANSFDLINGLMRREHEFIQKEFDLKEQKDEDTKTNLS